MERRLWLKPQATARCGHCGERQPVPVAAVGYRCRSCGADWRWAVCGNCELVQVVREEIPAVECARCHTVHVSWWKTADSESIAGMIGEQRRRHDERRRQAWRRRVALLAVLFGLSLLAAWVLLL